MSRRYSSSRSGMQGIYNLGEVLCQSKLLAKQVCNISGMGMTEPLGIMGIGITIYYDINLSRNRKIALDINTKAVHMPSIFAMDWQVARLLEIRILDVVMQVGFTGSKDARVVLEQKCFKICAISPQTSFIDVVDSKRCR